MTETAWSNLKPDPIDCPCGCGLIGRPRVKIWRGETVGHVPGCQCKRCQGSRFKKTASARESRLAKKTGGRREQGSGNVTGRDVTTGAGTWVEETTNFALTRGFFAWWDSKQTQEKTKKVRENKVAPWAYTVSMGRRSFTIQETDTWAEKEWA